FEPTIASIPPNLRRKLEPAEAFHEILEHRWYLAEKAGHDIPTSEAGAAYVNNVLPNRPDEEAILQLDTATLRAISGDLDDDDEREQAARAARGRPARDAARPRAAADRRRRSRC